MPTRRCYDCKKTKDLNEFGKSSWGTQGYGHQCKKCKSQSDKDYRRKHKRQLQIYVRKRNLQGICAYQLARQRCQNPNNQNYSSYGGRGIQVLMTPEEWCKIWQATAKCSLCPSVLTFHQKGNQKCMDRIDLNGHYEVGNVRIICRSCNSKEKYKQWARTDLRPCLKELVRLYGLEKVRVEIKRLAEE